MSFKRAGKTLYLSNVSANRQTEPGAPVPAHSNMSVASCSTFSACKAALQSGGREGSGTLQLSRESCSFLSRGGVKEPKGGVEDITGEQIRKRAHPSHVSVHTVALSCWALKSASGTCAFAAG